MRLFVKRLIIGMVVIACVISMNVVMWRNGKTTRYQATYIESDGVSDDLEEDISGDIRQRTRQRGHSRRITDNSQTANSSHIAEFKSSEPDDDGLNPFTSTSTDSGQSLHRQTDSNDIFISVKTTFIFHKTRLDLLLRTWFVLAREQTYFFTDAKDEEYSQKTNGHLVNTECSSKHSRVALCCKMSFEYDAYIDSKKRWFCHVDDDTYVNVPQLISVLQRYNHTDDWYLGKPSLGHPIEIMDRDNPGKYQSFWFATGGAGFCISHSLALKMMPYASGGRLNKACDKIRLPDDCTIGYIICHVLGVPLTVLHTFHSHLEGLWMLRPEDFHKQVTFSYSKSSNNRINIVNVNGIPPDKDPTRLLSLHCHLFPTFRVCTDLTSGSPPS